MAHPETEKRPRLSCLRLSMEHVTLPRALIERLFAQARHSPEAEICGLISGHDDELIHCHPVTNVATDRTRFFEMEPEGLIAAMRQMRERGEELLAIYHSHPNSPPVPSLTDVQQHEYPSVLYLIISLQTQGVPEMRGYRIRDQKIQEVAIGISST